MSSDLDLQGRRRFPPQAIMVADCYLIVGSALGIELDIDDLLDVGRRLADFVPVLLGTKLSCLVTIANSETSMSLVYSEGAFRPTTPTTATFLLLEGRCQLQQLSV